MNSKEDLRFDIANGLDIPVDGAPEQTIFAGQVPHAVALMGSDYNGLKPRLLVEPGQFVRLGEPLFVDKRDTRVQFTAPGTGRIAAVNRGSRRALQSIVIDLDEIVESQIFFNKVQLQDRSAIRDLLQQSGAWTAFRTRPFDRVPPADATASAIFVTAIDTRPLAPRPEVVIAERQEEFTRGLELVATLSEGTTFLCTDSGWAGPEPEAEQIRRVEFSGPHPAGLPGTHIHYLLPAGTKRTVWHINYQDVIAIGYLVLTGRILMERVISIAGPGVVEPRLIRTRLGASISDLLKNEMVKTRNCQSISGSVLDGFAATGHMDYIGRYHNQVSVLFESSERDWFGWFSVGSRKFSFAGLFSTVWNTRLPREFTNARNGRRVAMVPVEAFEKVMPLDILPVPLFRALLVKDTDSAQALGCLELAEDDLALSSFVCPAKQDYGAALRANLDQIELEG
jgi:Na+-transporting NADH:ubiquinone oxidoreductase subunit A